MNERGNKSQHSSHVLLVLLVFWTICCFLCRHVSSFVYHNVGVRNVSSSSTPHFSSTISSTAERDNEKKPADDSTIVIQRVEYVSQLKEVANLFMLCFPDNQNLSWWEQIFKRGDIQRRLEYSFRFSDPGLHQMLVAKMNNKIVGYCDVDARPPTWRHRQDLPRPLLADLMTHPEYRRKGIGNELMQRSENFVRQLKDHPTKYLYLRVKHENHVAVNMYKNLDFNEIALPKMSSSKTKQKNKDVNIAKTDTNHVQDSMLTMRKLLD